MYVGMQVYRQYVHIETHYFTSFHLILKKSHFGVKKTFKIRVLKTTACQFCMLQWVALGASMLATGLRKAKITK